MRLAVAQRGVRLRICAAALLAVAILVLIATPFDRGTAQTTPVNRWTFFVWMAADNDLEPQGIEDMKEMELGIPEEGVEIIVFVDRFTPNSKRFGDWSGGRLYRIRPNRERMSFASELLQEFGPVDSSDPKLFADQMGAAFKRFPAEKYGAILWNHGGGWASLAIDEHNPQAPGKKTGLTIVQAGDALRGGIQQLGTEPGLLPRAGGNPGSVPG